MNADSFIFENCLVEEICEPGAVLVQSWPQFVDDRAVLAGIAWTIYDQIVDHRKYDNRTLAISGQ